MKLVFSLFAICAAALAITSCGNNGGQSSGGLGQQMGIGPFDSRGNYIEELADSPSKWRRPGSSTPSRSSSADALPEIAQNDQPPMNSIPLAASSSSSRTTSTISETKVTQKAQTSAVVVKSTPKKPVTVTTSKPKPKVVAKAKPKPKTTRYVVKKGDSLSAIASRNGVSVSALKSANSISGTLIQPGQSLTIPKK